MTTRIDSDYATLAEQAHGPVHTWECICEGQSRFFYSLPGEGIGDHRPECPFANPGTHSEFDMELADQYEADAPPEFIPMEYCDYDAEEEV